MGEFHFVMEVMGWNWLGDTLTTFSPFDEGFRSSWDLLSTAFDGLRSEAWTFPWFLRYGRARNGRGGWKRDRLPDRMRSRFTDEMDGGDR